jgi:hypothetical protein
MGILRRMGKQGDVPTKWELDDNGSIQVAEERFNDAIRNHMLAFNMDAGEGERISKFDPNAKEIVLIPQIAGGE